MTSRVLIMILILLIVSVSTMAESMVSGNESLIEISSQESLKAYLENQTKWYDEIYLQSDYRSDILLPEFAAMPSATSAPAPGLQKDAGGATDYSATNVQVEGVDEADYLKNDGRYIYMLRGDILLIIEVFPVDSGKIVSSTKIPGNPSGLFLKGDNLIVFTSEYSDTWRIVEGSVAPVPIQADITHAKICYMRIYC